MTQSNNMLPARTGARGSQQAGASEVARSRSRSRTAVPATSHTNASPRPDNHRAGTTVTAPIPPTRAAAAAATRLAQGEQRAAERQAAEEQYTSEHYAADEEYMYDDEEEYMDDYLHDLRQLRSQFLVLEAPLAQAIANLAASAFQVPPAPPAPPAPLSPLRGIELDHTPIFVRQELLEIFLSLN
jgi:hypothetical protein